MATIERYCAPFLAGQVPYAPDGTVNHIGNFMGQARQVFGSARCRTPTT
jgi:enamine deaminase RidA (YjgF/YER057c/UK114 family)